VTFWSFLNTPKPGVLFLIKFASDKSISWWEAIRTLDKITVVDKYFNNYSKS
jgi:hypothetical protein